MNHAQHVSNQKARSADTFIWKKKKDEEGRAANSNPHRQQL